MLRQSASPTADVSVAIDSRPLYAGDTLDVEVQVTPHVSFLAALGVLRLSRVELLRVDSARDAVPQMMLPGRRGSRNQGGPAHIDEVFAEDAPMEAGVPQVYPVRLRLPDAAPPTVKGKYARISWELSASVLTRADWLPAGDGWLANLARGRAAHCEQELVVFSRSDVDPMDGLPLIAEFQASRTYRNVTLDLSLDSAQVANGGIVTGSLSVKSRSAFTARELRVELTRWERSGSKQARVIEGCEVLQRPAILAADEETEWAFRLPVPDPLMPSVMANHTFVGWQVRAVIDRKLRPNQSVSQLLHVYTSP